MMDNLIAWKAAIVAAVACLGSVLGWKGALVLCLAAAMVLDFITGTAAAVHNGDWASKAVREGVWHKAGTVVVVLTAGLCDLGLSVVFEHYEVGLQWDFWMVPMVSSWYLVSELGSILENAVKMGAPVPGWLSKILRITKAAIEKAGEEITEAVELPQGDSE